MIVAAKGVLHPPAAPSTPAASATWRHMTFDGEEGLGKTEPGEGPGGRRIGSHRETFDRTLGQR
jgi:hypothetical protein